MRISDCSVGGQILKQVGDRVALALQCGSRERNTGRRLRVDAGRVVDEVSVKAAFLDLLRRQVTRQLIDDCGDHLLMGQFLCTDIGQDSLAFLIRHRVALVEIAHCRADLTIRSTELQMQIALRPLSATHNIVS